MSRSILARTGLAALFLATGVTAARAEQVITADTRLTATIVSADPTKPCIRIAASGVTLDLNGFTVAGRGGKGIGIAIDPGLFNVTIRKGTVADFATGVVVNEGATHHLEDLVVTRSSEVGIHATGAVKAQIGGCTVRKSGDAGILLENCQEPYVHHNTVQDNGDAGIRLGNGSQGARVERNVSRYNDGPGIAVSGGAAPNLLQRNTAAQNGTFDLQDDNGDCRSNTWSRNLFLTANIRCID